MEVAELLAGLEQEATQAEDWVNELLRELPIAQQRLTDIRLEAKAVRSAVQRLSGETSGPTAPDPSWLVLPGVDAVERCLISAIYELGIEHPTFSQGPDLSLVV